MAGIQEGMNESSVEILHPRSKREENNLKCKSDLRRENISDRWAEQRCPASAALMEHKPEPLWERTGSGRWTTGAAGACRWWAAHPDVRSLNQPSPGSWDNGPGHQTGNYAEREWKRARAVGGQLGALGEMVQTEESDIAEITQQWCKQRWKIPKLWEGSGIRYGQVKGDVRTRKPLEL